MKEFTEYLKAIKEEENRTKIQLVLEWAEQTFPDLKSKIAWNQPMFTDHDTFIIGFSVSKQHFSVAPETRTIEIFAEEIKASGYSLGSNIFRIKWADPVDYDLLERVIRFNIEDKMDCKTFWRK